jgi:hypothetical protein
LTTVKQRARRFKRREHRSDRKFVPKYVSRRGRRAGLLGAAISCLMVAGHPNNLGNAHIAKVLEADLQTLGVH